MNDARWQDLMHDGKCGARTHADAWWDIVFCRLSSGWPGEGLTDREKRRSVPPVLTTRPQMHEVHWRSNTPIQNALPPLSARRAS